VLPLVCYITAYSANASQDTSVGSGATGRAWERGYMEMVLSSIIEQ